LNRSSFISLNKSVISIVSVLSEIDYNQSNTAHNKPNIRHNQIMTALTAMISRFFIARSILLIQ